MILTPLHKCKTVYGLEVDGIDVYIFCCYQVIMSIGTPDWSYKYTWIGIEHIIFIDNVQEIVYRMQYSRNNLTRKNNLKDFSYHIDLHGYICMLRSQRRGLCRIKNIVKKVGTLEEK